MLLQQRARPAARRSAPAGRRSPAPARSPPPPGSPRPGTARRARPRVIRSIERAERGVDRPQIAPAPGRRPPGSAARRPACRSPRRRARRARPRRSATLVDARSRRAPRGGRSPDRGWPAPAGLGIGGWPANTPVPVIGAVGDVALREAGLDPPCLDRLDVVDRALGGLDDQDQVGHAAARRPRAHARAPGGLAERPAISVADRVVGAGDAAGADRAGSGPPRRAPAAGGRAPAAARQRRGTGGGARRHGGPTRTRDRAAGHPAHHLAVDDPLELETDAVRRSAGGAKTCSS